MLRDITLGQYFPGKSIVHRLDPRFKLLLTALYIAIIFCAKTPVGYTLSALLLIGIVLLSKIPPVLLLKSIKGILFFIVFTVLFNVLFTTGDHILFSWRFIVISREGLLLALAMVIRIVLLICGTSMLTYTTSPIALTDALESVMAPLNRIHFPVHELSMMMSIALRFIPTLIEETDKIMSAQKSRGADFESGNLARRAKSLIPLLIPLFVSAFRRADELATAMESRCYRGGEGRTKYRIMKSHSRDYVSALIFILVLAGVIMLRVIGL